MREFAYMQIIEHVENCCLEMKNQIVKQCNDQENWQLIFNWLIENKWRFYFNWLINPSH